MGAGKSPSWFLHSIYESQCRRVNLLLLAYQHNSFAPQALTWVNHTHFQHLFHVSMNLIYHKWRDSLEPLLEGLIINDFDLMFCQYQYSPTPQVPRKRCHGIQLIEYVWWLDIGKNTPPGQTSAAVGRVLPFSAQLTY